MKKNIFGKIVCFLLAAVMLTACLCGCGKEKEDKTKVFSDKVDVTGYGLHVSQNGWITLNGKPFYGFGLVWKDAFRMMLNDTSADLEPYFKKLSEGGIPYVRVMIGPDNADMVFKYTAGKDSYLAALDKFLALAEKYEIGVIANLFWDLEGTSAAFGENIKQISQEKEAESYKFVNSFISDIVTKYKDSKAVWAWELSNEGNMMCEVKKFEVVYSDGSTYMSNYNTTLLTDFYTYTSEAIRNIDKYRMIINGDASPRFFAKALRDEYYTAPWDTYEDLVETFTCYAPGSVDCLSVHTPYISFLEKYTKAGKELKKGLYVGAFCGTLNKNLDESVKPEDDVFEANEQESFNAYVDAYLEYGIQMATAMNFASYAVNPEDDASIETGTTEGIVRNTYAWDRLVSENAKLAADGKNNAAGYWSAD